MIKKIKNILILVLSMCMLFNTVAFAAVSAPNDIVAESAILVEKSTGTVVYEKNADQKMYPASMTKILTGIIALEYFNKDDVITVGTEINDISLDSSKAGHIVGEKITTENLLRGLFIPSGNDSGAVIAVSVARKVENNENLSANECLAIFANMMNEKAEELGCTNSNFENPHGYHDENHYTTASDMAKIVSAAMDNETLCEIASEKYFSGNSLGDLQSQYPDAITNDYNWQSHNMLIAASSEYNYEYATGFKTGFTDEAGDCVAATAEKDGVQLIAVIMKSEDPARWTDAQKLFDFAFNNYSLETVAKNGETVINVGLAQQKSSEGEELELISKKDIVLYRPTEDFENMETILNITAENIVEPKNEDDQTLIKAPVTENDEIGTVTYKTSDGEEIATVTVYASRNIEKANIFARMAYAVKDFVLSLFTLQGLLTALGAIVVIAIIIIIIIIIIKLIRRRRGGFGGYGGGYRYKSSRRRRF